jgi:phosphatidylglycerol---prolipoprotein diacylglyceryl transferase
MFPYIDSSTWHIGNVPFNPFIALVAVALATGYLIASARAHRSGIDPEQFAKLGLCVMFAAFLGGHLAKFFYLGSGFSMLFIQPSLWFHVLSGQASFGAFIGGFLGAVIFLWSNKVPYRDQYLYADAACFAVPFSWWIGRVGCYLVHDHPGIRTTSIFGVRYPGGTRFDLGLLEVLFLLALSAIFLVLDRRKRPRGFYYVAFLFSYGIFRFWLDSLHVDPPRYAGWTVDQIAAGIMIVTGLLTLLELYRLRFLVK